MYTAYILSLFDIQGNATVINLKPSWGQKFLVLRSQPKSVDTAMALEYSGSILNSWVKKNYEDKMTSMHASFTFILEELW